MTTFYRVDEKTKKITNKMAMSFYWWRHLKPSEVKEKIRSLPKEPLVGVWLGLDAINNHRFDYFDLVDRTDSVTDYLVKKYSEEELKEKVEYMIDNYFYTDIEQLDLKKYKEVSSKGIEGYLLEQKIEKIQRAKEDEDKFRLI